MDVATCLTPWTIGGEVASLALGVGALIVLVINRRHVGVAFKRLAPDQLSASLASSSSSSWLSAC